MFDSVEVANTFPPFPNSSLAKVHASWTMTPSESQNEEECVASV